MQTKIEVVRKLWKKVSDSPFVFRDMYIFGDGRELNAEEFSSYLKSINHKIILV